MEEVRRRPPLARLSPHQIRKETTPGRAFSMGNAAGSHCRSAPPQRARAEGERIMRFPWRARNRRNDELHEEIQAHVTLAEREEMESGRTKKEAEFAARREFGNVSIAEETTRDMW